MGKGVSIPIASETREFASGVKRGVIDPLEDAVDVLLEVERAGERAGDELEDAMRDAERSTKDAKEEASKLERALRDAERQARDTGRAGKDAGDDIDAGMHRAEEGVQGFKDEAKQNAEEVASSFDGSVESIADGFQGLAATALSGFGPAGVVAGVAAAAGIGLAVAGFEAVGEAEEESRERASEWAAAYIEAGSTVLSAATQAQMAQDIITDPERWQEAQDNAQEWGVSAATAVAAMTGETWALAAANASLTERESEAAANMVTLSDSGEVLSEMLQGATAETRNGREALDALTQQMENGELGAATYSETLQLMAQNTAGATQTTNEFGDAVYALPDGTTVTVDADTGQATLDISNVDESLSGLDGSSATVTATAQTSGAENALTYLVRNRSATIMAHVRDQRGVPIPF